MDCLLYRIHTLFSKEYVPCKLVKYQRVEFRIPGHWIRQKKCHFFSQCSKLSSIFQMYTHLLQYMELLSLSGSSLSKLLDFCFCMLREDIEKQVLFFYMQRYLQKCMPDFFSPNNDFIRLQTFALLYTVVEEIIVSSATGIFLFQI